MAHLVTRVAAGLAVAGALHAAANVRLLRRAPTHTPPVDGLVSVLVPARDEAANIGDCLDRLRAQDGVDLEILVLDDGSTDATAAVVAAAAADDRRVRLLTGAPLPPGWLGKPWACAQLAEAARGDILVFLDADVRLEASAVRSAVALLDGLDFVSPHPRQLAETPVERLVQPLLQWSFLTTLPLRLAERNPRPSLAAANGQFLAVRRAAYEKCGGHASVRGEVVDDIGLARSLRRAGAAGGIVDGTDLAWCRMYSSWPDLRDGYTKNLAAAFGSPTGAVAAAAGLGIVYVLPAVAALAGSRAGLVGYAAGVAGRVVSARATGGRAWPYALAHPASVGAFGYLTVRSAVQRRRWEIRWNGRPV